MNKYTYSHNNPISYYDPTGHSIKSILENTVKKIKETVKVAKAIKPVVEQTFKAVATVAINTEVKNMLSPIAKIVKYAENKTQNVRNQYQLALAIGKGEAFPQLMNISANYSQGMYDTIGSQINGFMQFYDNPVQNAGSSLNYFLSDPLKNNPIYGAYQYGKDLKRSVSAHDWDTASYKLGVGVVNTAEVVASIAIGGKIGGKIPTGKVSVPKVGVASKIRNAIDNFGTPALAGANGMVISGAVPAEASVASTAGAGALGVRVGAAIGQNVVYSSKFSNQISSGGASKGNLSGGGTSYKSRNKPVQSEEPNSVNVQRDANGNVTKYTEFGDKGEFIKEVRLTGKEHGGIPRPNVKEPNFNINHNTGERFQNGYTVRPATSAEITKIK